MDQRDPEKDSISIRTDIFKQAATVAGLIATLYGTFFLTGIKEPLPHFWLLTVGLFLLFLVVILSVPALGNIAISVRKGDYGVPGPTKFVFRVTYGAFVLGFLCIAIFTIINARRLANQNTPEVRDAVKTYVEGYFKGTTPGLVQKELEKFGSQIGEKLQNAITNHDQQLRRYIDDKLKETTSVTPSIQQLQVQIAVLQEQIALLLGSRPAPAGHCTFTRDLFLGVKGDDVMCLQQYLNAQTLQLGTQIATSGPGSPGKETAYFGALTKAAVSKWQSANGISPPSGYFGTRTRAKYNALVPIPSATASSP